MFVQFCEESMLTLGIRIIFDMNAVRFSQVFRYGPDLEHTGVFTPPLEVMFTAEKIWNEDQGSTPNSSSIFVIRG
ncbi:MAG: hypothetical protein OER22_12235 [Gammaproteobacteria bacterium]|nr:hypothetical protein [Gammaproteobacteria bacterium]